MAVKSQPGNPTLAPKSDRQSAATTRIDYIKFVPGYVSVRQGLEVLPVTPKFDIATRLIAIPNNAKAIITFDKTGRAVRVRLTKSAGHIGYDSPLLESLYRWRVKGRLLKQIKSTISVPMDLILR